MFDFYHYIYIYLHEVRYIKAQKKLWKDVILTKEQEKELQAVFGKKTSNKWHRLYQSYTGEFNKDYFPEILFSTKLEPILCPRGICEVLQDKGLIGVLYHSVPELRLPKTVIVNCSGIFYDGNRNIINKETAADLVYEWSKRKRFVIKPTVGTHSGAGVVIGKQDAYNSSEEILTLFHGYKKNFIVQEYIINSKELRALYDNSLNTIRIMTYILEDKLYHAPLILRIGKGGNEVDNVGIGGLFVGLSDDGYLKKEAFTRKGEGYCVHPDSRIRFEGYPITGIDKIIECAFACHKKTPHTKFISWDFTFDENNVPVLIEANLLGHSSWLPQAASGVSTFGSNTNKMLDKIRVRS
jgi:hypothetical protein